MMSSDQCLTFRGFQMVQGSSPSLTVDLSFSLLQFLKRLTWTRIFGISVCSKLPAFCLPVSRVSSKMSAFLPFFSFPSKLLFSEKTFGNKWEINWT